MKRRNILAGLAACALLAAPVQGFALPADDALTLAARAQTEEAQGAYDAALTDFTQAIEMHTLGARDQARLLFDRGLALDSAGRLDDAVGDYGAVIALAADFAPALNNRANVYRRQSRLAEARRDYLAALGAGNPLPAYSWYGLGQVAEAEGNTAAARDNYAHAVAADPGFALAKDRLAVLGGMAPATDRAEVIHLHPPVPAQTQTPPWTQAEAKPNDVPIVLKPPSGFVAAPAGEVADATGAADAPPLHLHSPPPDASAGRLTPARYNPKPDAKEGDVVASEPGLRPALDGGDGAGTASDGPSGAPSGALVQLGAWRSEAEASAGWTKAVRQAGGLLDGVTSHIVTADLPGKGRYYRLRAGPVSGPPVHFCEALTARGMDCIPARN